MASLYIKDRETAAIATRLAALQGKTKTQAVKDALLKAEEAEAEATTPSPQRDFLAWLADWRERNPMPPAKGPPADKAFYDWLSGDDDL